MSFMAYWFFIMSVFGDQVYSTPILEFYFPLSIYISTKHYFSFREHFSAFNCFL